MRAAARAAFVAFSSRLEGVVPWMYLDILGLVTVGIGNLIDPVSAALVLPFVLKSDMTTPATRDQIRAEWEMVKEHPTASKQGHLVLQAETTLRLTAEGVEDVVGGRLALNEDILTRRFPDFATWPADAQLATHSMAWACGAGFNFPRLAEALRAGDFATAAAQCHIDDTRNPGVTPRNAANVELYTNAARVVAEGLDPDVLLYGAPPAPLIEGDIVHPELDLEDDVEPPTLRC